MFMKSLGCSCMTRGAWTYWIPTLAAFILALSPGLAEGSWVTTAEGFGADAYVKSSLFNNDANVNYGSETYLAIKHDTGLPGNNRKGYLRFDLSSIGAPITGAKLELVYGGDHPDSQSPSVYNIYALNDGHPGENWNESTITWNNAPGNNPGSAGGVDGASTTFLGTFTLQLSSLTPGDSVSFSSSGYSIILSGFHEKKIQKCKRIAVFLQRNTSRSVLVFGFQEGRICLYFAFVAHGYVPPCAHTKDCL